jgi:hypothetical protein
MKTPSPSAALVWWPSRVDSRSVVWVGAKLNDRPEAIGGSFHVDHRPLDPPRSAKPIDPEGDPDGHAARIDREGVVFRSLIPR